MKITVLTQFPEMFGPVLDSSILGRAKEKGLLKTELVNIRDYSVDKHRKTDDAPFGGGYGMVMTPQPAFDALKGCGAEGKRILYMSPRGRMLDKDLACELSKEEELFILCGHYEGIDQRIIDAWSMEEVSIGDYILTGGELASMVLIDCVARLIPGCLSDEDAAVSESIYSGLLEYDQYTKPREFRGLNVPDVLWGGNHRFIHLWQYENALRLTKKRRPDLFEEYVRSEKSLTKDEKKILDTVFSEY
ncbi:MAG: tRNA (guanosine(37)-N1)-methyltransferase TrmD [Firmicutes bacterium]|nr:tRNA (guanosine(37)-N1)-methyltransferase TrmD [Bacillota bacterium]